jgi:hypothetical protein
MATGDQTDIASRLFRWLPSKWFSDATGTIVRAVQAGFAAGLSIVYAMVVYAGLQVRIKTATDGFLDLISGDYFGTRFPRIFGESDSAFRARILQELLRERGTRHGVFQALLDLTGRAPIIFEPSRPKDTGAYDVASSLGYDMAGGYAELDLPCQSFVTAFRPLSTQGVPNVAPYDVVNGVGAGAYAAAGIPPGSVVSGTAAYADIDSLTGVSDAQIFAAIEAVRAAGTIIWVRISS